MREPIPLDGQPVVVIISRDQVEARDTSSVIQILEILSELTGECASLF